MTEEQDKSTADAFDQFRQFGERYLEQQRQIPFRPENLPGHPSYEKHCDEFMSRRDTWSISEAINLIVGCLPNRQLILQGQDELNRAVELIKSRIISCAGESLQVINRDKKFEEWRVRRREFLRWAKEMQIQIPDELDRPEIENNPLSELSYQGYSTKSLRITGDVIENFWTNFDEQDQSTHHKQTVIIDWLRSKFGISGNEARAIDSIVRPEFLKKGGQSKIGDA